MPQNESMVALIKQIQLSILNHSTPEHLAQTLGKIVQHEKTLLTVQPSSSYLKQATVGMTTENKKAVIDDVTLQLTDSFKLTLKQLRDSFGADKLLPLMPNQVLTTSFYPPVRENTLCRILARVEGYKLPLSADAHVKELSIRCDFTE